MKKKSTYWCSIDKMNKSWVPDHEVSEDYKETIKWDQEDDTFEW